MISVPLMYQHKCSQILNTKWSIASLGNVYQDTTSPDCPCPSPWGSPHPAYGPVPYVSPLGPPAPAPVMLQQGQSLAPHIFVLPSHGLCPAWPTHGPTSWPGLSPSPSPGRCPMLRGWGCPSAPQYPAPGWGWDRSWLPRPFRNTMKFKNICICCTCWARGRIPS